MKKIYIKRFREMPDKFTGITYLTNGNVVWWLNGQRHREDGPAVIWKNGIDMHYYLFGKYVDRSVVELFYMLKYKKIIEL